MPALRSWPPTGPSPGDEPRRGARVGGSFSSPRRPPRRTKPRAARLRPPSWLWFPNRKRWRAGGGPLQRSPFTAAFAGGSFSIDHCQPEVMVENLSHHPETIMRCTMTLVLLALFAVARASRRCKRPLGQGPHHLRGGGQGPHCRTGLDRSGPADGEELGPLSYAQVYRLPGGELCVTFQVGRDHYCDQGILSPMFVSRDKGRTWQRSAWPHPGITGINPVISPVLDGEYFCIPAVTGIELDVKRLPKPIGSFGKCPVFRFAAWRTARRTWSAGTKTSRPCAGRPRARPGAKSKSAGTIAAN